MHEQAGAHRWKQPFRSRKELHVQRLARAWHALATLHGRSTQGEGHACDAQDKSAGPSDGGLSNPCAEQ